MDKQKKLIMSIIALAILIILFYFTTKAITTISGKSITGAAVEKPGEEKMEDFAKCLSVNGVKMYGAFWCGHCQNQKKMFDESVQFISYIECDPRGENSGSDLCLAKGIQGYPTWEINGELYPGEMSLERLAELSGCKLS